MIEGNQMYREMENRLRDKVVQMNSSSRRLFACDCVSRVIGLHPYAQYAIRMARQYVAGSVSAHYLQIVSDAILSNWSESTGGEKDIFWAVGCCCTKTPLCAEACLRAADVAAQWLKGRGEDFAESWRKEIDWQLQHADKEA